MAMARDVPVRYMLLELLDAQAAETERADRAEQTAVELAEHCARHGLSTAAWHEMVEAMTARMKP